MKKILLMAALAAVAGVAFGGGKGGVKPAPPAVSTFTDKRDGKTYKTVEAGVQTWMAENLNYEAKGSVCNDSNDANCAKYGRLYDYATALKSCPDGWHLPNYAEWEILVDYAGGLFTAGTKLKSKSGWDDCDDCERKSGNGTDDFGFSALPGGSFDNSGVKYHGIAHFGGIGKQGHWWSAPTDKYGRDSRAIRRYMFNTIERVGRDGENNNGFMSVRCVQGGINDYKTAVARYEKEKSKGETVETAAERDAKKYRTIKVGAQTWMAENLNYAAEGSKCYENKDANCAKYGRLYDWETAMKACPAGFHLASDKEWTTLTDYAGGVSTAGGKLKSRSGWEKGYKERSGNGTDNYGFSALPGGVFHEGGESYGAGSMGYWWSATESNANYAWHRFMTCSEYPDTVVRGTQLKRGALHSVRCVQDDDGYKAAMARNDNEKQKSKAEKVETAAERDAKKYRTIKAGTQTWMAENLNYAAKGSLCYDNDAGNCEKYGRLYDWAAALKACPAGFHLPSDKEWETLVNYAGGEGNAGAKLKSKSGWNNNGNGADDYGFSALPAGYGLGNGMFVDAGSHGLWWSATGYWHDNNMAIMMGMHLDSKQAGLNVGDKTNEFLSVRCVADKGGVDDAVHKAANDGWGYDAPPRPAAGNTPPKPAVTVNLPNDKSLKRGMTDAEFAQAYEIAAKLVAPYSAMSREKQIEAVAKRLYDYLKEAKITYSDKAPHYNDVY